MIQNLDDLDYAISDNQRIYVAGDDRDIEKLDWKAIDTELHREDRVNINPQVKESTKAILSANKRDIPVRKPIYDWKTSNESFLELHEDYKLLGIENNKFFLRLFDPDLQGVDPFFPNLPLEMQIKIFFEVWINPWYYLREICRIPQDGKPICVGGGSPYRIDRNGAATWFCFLNGIDHYGSRSRQLGKTMDALSKQLYAFNWGCIAANFLFFNKDFPQAKVNLYRLKCLREMLPTFLKMEFAYSEDGTIDKGQNNVTSMRNPLNGNTIKCMPKATSSDIANSQGRGDTAAMHYMDEFDFWPYGTTIMKAAAFSYATSSRNAGKNNSLHCRIATSTPGFTSTRDGKNAVEFIDHCLRWEDKFLDRPINQIKAMVNSTKRTGFMYIEHTWKQLKKTEYWYQEQCRLVDYDATTIAREIDLQRVSGNEMSPLKKEHQSYISSNIVEPIDRIDYSNNLCPFYVFEKIHRDYPYLLCIDPAEGFGKDHDNIAVTGLNPYNLRTVLEYKTPYVSQPMLFDMLIKLLQNYMPNACVIVEANKGRELINLFLASSWVQNLWYDQDKLDAKIVEVTNEYGDAERDAKIRRAYGFDTTPKTRPRLFSTLEVLLEEDIDTLCTPFIARDTLGLVQKPNGRVEAGKDEHDDNLISKLIGHYVYNNAKNLEEFGIVKGRREPLHEEELQTEDYKVAKLKEMLPNLPKEIQELFKTSTQGKNPVEEANKYYRQVDMQRKIYDSATGSIDSSYTQKQRVDTEVSDALYDSLFASNDEENQASKFNIEDYL